MTSERTLVAGAGLMGHGIAQVLAATGRSVALYEPEIGRASAGRDRIAANLERSVAKGRLDGAERDRLLDQISATDDLAGAAAGVDLVVEAVFEDLAVKTALWADIDRLAPERALFASNTSSIAIESLAAAVQPARRARFV